MRALLIARGLDLLAVGSADAQWLLLGRKAVGRIEYMIQSPDSARPKAPRDDVAVVLLEATAAKVYDSVIATGPRCDHQSGDGDSLASTRV